MKILRSHPLETLLVGTATLLTVAGFWNIYFGPQSTATPFHHLHLATTLLWLALLIWQLTLIGANNYSAHRSAGLSVLVAAPLLVASAALLSVESAHKGLSSGQGDFMIVQNVLGTMELALLIFLGFALRRRRKLHASFLTSTALLFIGIAMFFSLIGHAPGFKIEGPDTFYRFGKALTTIQYASLAIGFLFFAKSPRYGWPYLLAGSSFLLNELIKSALARHGLIQPLTEVVGSINQPLAFFGSFGALLVLLVATGILGSGSRGRSNNSPKPTLLRGAA